MYGEGFGEGTGDFEFGGSLIYEGLRDCGEESEGLDGIGYIDCCCGGGLGVILAVRLGSRAGSLRPAL